LPGAARHYEVSYGDTEALLAMRNFVWVIGLACSACHPLTSIPTYWPPTFAEHTPAPERVAPPERPRPAPRPRVAKAKLQPPKKVERPKVKIQGPPECMSVYVVSAQNKLLAFDPQENRFDERGKLSCPGAGFSTPFSMAVSKKGIAHVLFQNGKLYRVGVDKADCEATTFQPNQEGFRLFGMGYSPKGDDETLYVAEIGFYRKSRGLAHIDTNDYTLHPVAQFSENPGFNVELTPTGKGMLHGFFINAYQTGGTLVAIDTDNASIVKATPLPVGTQSNSLAVSWWGGDFYIFTAMRLGTQVTRYDPEAGATAVVATIDQTIVGAGVSTCAPGRQTASL
jgi:hypothetical protein